MSEREDDLVEALWQIDQWCKAYPETIFRPISKEKLAEANDALKAIGVDMGAMHAQWARHLLTGIGGIAEAALAKAKHPVDEPADRDHIAAPQS